MRSDRKPSHANRLILISAMPFPLAILVTLLFVFTVGIDFPRDVAPGSSLVLPGLAVSGAILSLITARIRQGWIEAAPRRFSLILCTATSLMAWPVWTMGILPSVNGMRLDTERTSTMRLSTLTFTHASKSRQIYYWARLQQVGTETGIGDGRYFIPKAVYDAWQGQIGRTVTVRHATGLLGAETVLEFG